MRTPDRASLGLASIALVLMLSGCRQQGYRSEKALPAPAGPKDPDLAVTAAGYHGRSFRGPAYIPRSSPMADGTTAYTVIYQKGVTVVSKEDVTRYLVNIHNDGSYLFDRGAKQIARLQAGNIVLLSGLALRTVVAVQSTAAGYVLKTGPAKITDAIKDGRLEGIYNIDFSRMMASEIEGAQGAADFDVNFSGYDYHVRFTPGDDRIQVQATIKFGGSQGALAYESVGYMSNFVSTIRMQVKDSKLTKLEFTNTNVDGKLNLKWYAVTTGSTSAGTMAKITSWPAELVKNAVLSKVAYHVPIVVGALPFDLRLSLGFSFIPSFTSTNSVVEGNDLIRYNGGGGVKLGQGQTRSSGSFNVQSEVSGHDSRVVASGPVGFTAATEAPRLELAMGWPPAAPAVAGYLNFVASHGIVTNGVANSAPCQTNIMAFSVNAGAASLSPNSFAEWDTTGASPSVSLWSKTFKSAGSSGLMCPG